MRKLIILAIFALVGCSAEEPCETCEAVYYNPELEIYYRENTTDCEMTAPEGYYFVECLEIYY